MTRYLILFTVFFFSISQFAKAQEEFSQLSTKKRISIAEKEEREAIHDREFQVLMQEGNEYFKEKHYLKAIRKYEQAQEKRPYNVYPKVIIADIELSMKDTLETLRAVETAEQNLKSQPKKELTESPKPEEVEPKNEEERRRKQEEWEKNERAKLEHQREKAKEEKPEPPIQTDGEVIKLSIADLQKELGEQFPTGVTEEVTREGNKTITKRIVVENNLGNEYKKVVHDWGGVFFFKNGEAVTERVWLKETEN